MYKYLILRQKGDSLRDLHEDKADVTDFDKQFRVTISWLTFYAVCVVGCCATKKGAERFVAFGVSNENKKSMGFRGK